MDTPADVGSLVRLWADLIVTDAVAPLHDSILGAGSVLRPPSDADSIREAERRVGNEFPDSYRQFLLTSDGALADWQGAAIQLSTGATASFGLLPAGEVSRFADTRPDIVQNWAGLGLPEPERVEQRREGCEVDYYKPLMTATLVNRDRGRYYMCLVAVSPEFDAGGEGAELWDAGHTGPNRYFTFANWLRSQVKAGWLSPRTRPEILAGQDAARSGAARGMPRFIRLLRWADADTTLLSDLQRWSTDDDPYIRLAAAQAGLGHFPAIAIERLTDLQRQDEPTVSLAARTTVRRWLHTPSP